MKSVGHKMILASAGSGKTYALTNRFVQLLACGAPPERIVALTFTRKAAGEFFDEILNKLARAAGDAREAARIAADIGEPQLGTVDFLRMLRAMVGAMHRLALGTLDGFFARVVRAFPLELGLGGDFEILQEHGARLERQRVLRQLFARTGGDLDDAQKEFVEAFKRATFGAEEKRLAARLDQFIDLHQEVYLSAPDGEAWGNRLRIWPAKSVWLDTKDDARAAASAIRAWAATACASEEQRARWDDFIEAFESWAPGAMLADPLLYVLKKAVEAWASLGEGTAELVIERKKQRLSAECCAALAALTRTVFAGELARRLETTRGIHTVLRGYEAVYHDLVRRSGKLTFADVQRLLMPDAGHGFAGQGAPRLTSGDQAAEGRLLVDWRLDAKFDHWLLDEFQDTSHGQWSVLRNLIDEAVQDPEARRSFFYVGDVKQAIYGWRGGDPRLFREIFNHYNAEGTGRIEEGRLDESWRSGPAIVAVVNKVFGNEKALARLMPGPTAKRWTSEWRDHVSARPQLDGHVAWLHGDDDEARAALTLRLLQEIEPLERGLSIAVLVQSNDAATWLADFLRREGGLPAVAASDLQVCTDNPLTTVVLALLQAAAHPGDRFAWEHVRMTPLADVLIAEELGNQPDELTEGLLRQVHAEGFARTVEAWVRRLEPVLAPADVFSRERARQLTEAAQLFDGTGSRDVAEFVQFAERHVVREAETAAIVRVMTIHKSKGLGFDVVVLPDLEGNSLSTRRRDGLGVQRTVTRAVEWVLDIPPKLFHENDPVLAAHVEAAEAETAYEKLCLYYVAMTRAKRAVYLITKPVGAKSVSANFPRLLTETLGTVKCVDAGRVGAWRGDGFFAEGNPAWFEGIAFVAAEIEDAGGTGSIELVAETLQVARYQARTPSGTKAGVVSGASLFSAGGTSAAIFGTAVHAAFAAVEWGGVTPELLVGWEAAGLGVNAVTEVLACLQAPALLDVWKRPAVGGEVWRERTFEIVLDQVWITGVFDRVVFMRDASGRVSEATVYDFKTDRIKPDELEQMGGRYAGQMAIYRRAAARLLGIPATRVRCGLVVTAMRRVVTVLEDRAD